MTVAHLTHGAVPREPRPPTSSQAGWAERFGEHQPARSAIEAPEFGRVGENALFMIEVATYRG